MQDLIRTDEQGNEIVYARRLSEELEVKERFSKWFERMKGYGFIEGVDYTPYQMVHPSNDQEMTDYVLTFDCAKEISMLQRTEKGQEVRRYFIQHEKRSKELIKKLTQPQSDMDILSNAVMVATRVIAEKDAQIKMLAPKAEFTDIVLKSSTCHTVTEIAKELGMTAIELNKALCERGIQFKHRGRYVLHSKYDKKGYTDTETHPYFGANGEIQTSIQMVWTEYGRVFIHWLFNQELSFSKSQQVA